jgi:hypothetical protein
MASGQLSGFKRFLLWDYPRAGWQYDVMVAAILAFIFLTPREVFRDQPRASNIVRLPAEHGTTVYWLERELLEATPEGQRSGKALTLLQPRYKVDSVVRVEPILDDERNTMGYMVYTRP